MFVTQKGPGNFERSPEVHGAGPEPTGLSPGAFGPALGASGIYWVILEAGRSGSQAVGNVDFAPGSMFSRIGRLKVSTRPRRHKES